MNWVTAGWVILIGRCVPIAFPHVFVEIWQDAFANHGACIERVQKKSFSISQQTVRAEFGL
jgi:hypothetical protein